MDSRLLKDEDLEILKQDYWSRLENEVEIIYINSRDPICQYCPVIKQLYREITSLTDKIKFIELFLEDDHDIIEKLGVKNAPATILRGLNKGWIKFYGIPAGNEFPSFIDAIVMISTGEDGLPDYVKGEITRIDKSINIKTFVTPSCPYCPKMVYTTYQFAMVNEFIEAEAWESLEFPDISAYYDVYAVPKVVINDKVSWEGLVPPEYLIEKIREAIREE